MGKDRKVLRNNHREEIVVRQKKRENGDERTRSPYEKPYALEEREGEKEDLLAVANPDSQKRKKKGERKRRRGSCVNDKGAMDGKKKHEGHLYSRARKGEGNRIVTLP